MSTTAGRGLAAHVNARNPGPIVPGDDHPGTRYRHRDGTRPTKYLIGISGDATNGYRLGYHASFGSPGLYFGTTTLTHTQYQVAANWNAGVTISTLWAADINRDGTPDLRTVLPDGTYRAYLISGLSTSGTANVTATRAQRLA